MRSGSKMPRLRQRSERSRPSTALRPSSMRKRLTGTVNPRLRAARNSAGTISDTASRSSRFPFEIA
jgi:hypothetical protein